MDTDARSAAQRKARALWDVFYDTLPPHPYNDYLRFIGEVTDEYDRRHRVGTPPTRAAQWEVTRAAAPARAPARAPTDPAERQGTHIQSTRARRTYDPSKLIRSAGGWGAFEFSAAQARTYEERDAAAIKAAIAAGPPKPCNDVTYPVSISGGSLNVYARRGGDDIGHLSAYKTTLGNRGVYTVGGAAINSYKDLASCPGLGTKMYEAAAREACKKGFVLAGSSLRSAFSQGFWGRQIDKGRATCYGARAGVYNPPMDSLRNRLTSGQVTVPQYNQLVANLPDDPGTGDWPCTYIPLDNCKGDKEKPTLPVDNTLRGLRKRLRR
jgi:hypothetical protein